MVRGPTLGRPGRIFLAAGVRLACGDADHDPRPFLLGAYACAAGTVFEERYQRLDDGSQHEHARLEEAWHLSWRPEDGASTVLPGDGGIHSVGNRYEETAVSVHLYGPRLEEIDGRDYDPSRDYVCDRLDDAD